MVLLKLPDESIKKKMFTSVVVSDRAHAASSAKAPSPRGSAWAIVGETRPEVSTNAVTAKNESIFFIALPKAVRSQLQI